MTDTVLIVLAGAFVLASGFALGWLATRSREVDLIDQAAKACLSLLVDEQIADDRNALESLPPGLLGADVYAHATRRGISIREAAEELFTAQARARLAGNLRRHHPRYRRSAR